MKLVWIPAVPFRSLYAIEPTEDGANCTNDPLEAMHFSGKESCEAWVPRGA